MKKMWYLMLLVAILPFQTCQSTGDFAISRLRVSVSESFEYTADMGKIILLVVEEKEPTQEELIELIMEEAKKYPNLNPSLVLKIAKAESTNWKTKRLDPKATGKAGEIGLFQLMPDTFKEVAQKMGLKNPDGYDPKTNIKMGVFYLNWLTTALGKSYAKDKRMLPLAFNWGIGNVWKHVAKNGCRIPKWFKNHPNLTYRSIYASKWA